MQFSFSEVELITLDEAVVSPTGLVYSTAPRRAQGSNGRSYFVKGGSVETVFAELGGCVAADALQIPVPAVALCNFQGEIYAGSENLNGIRDVSPWLRRRDRISNLTDLLRVVVVDTWLGNTDRNWGNLIGEPAGGDSIQLYFIDFEKSVALRPFPLMSTAMLTDRSLWPVGELGDLVKSWGHILPPDDILARISELDRDRCDQLLRPVATAIGIDWFDGTLDALARRASQIRALVEGVWNCN